ncbi:MAG: carbohydrate kinase family protein [Deltaproteobacteria bacterium]|nr:carbohydrate kinase family protein [Deltaproteobacteria bacterium]
MKFDCIGFGSINIDEFWETSPEFLELIGLLPGEEVVRDVSWFNEYYPTLSRLGTLRAIGPGGSAANTIAALRKMGFSTGFFGSVGDDIHGKMDLEELGSNNHLRIKHIDLPSGRCLALLNNEDHLRDRSLVILPNANDLVQMVTTDLSYFCNSSWIHFTSFVSEGPLKSQKELIKNLPHGVNVCFDPGLVYCRLGLSALEPIIARSNILFLTAQELTVLMGPDSVENSVSRLFSFGVNTVIVKLGSKGLKAFRSSDTWFQAAAYTHRVVDTTGAGDVAAAGILAGQILSLPMADCLALAANASARSIQGYGRSMYPDREYLRNFLADLNGRAHSC